MSIYIIFYSAYNVHCDSLHCPGEKNEISHFLSVYNFPLCKLKEVGRGVSCFNAILNGKEFLLHWCWTHIPIWRKFQQCCLQLGSTGCKYKYRCVYREIIHLLLWLILAYYLTSRWIPRQCMIMNDNVLQYDTQVSATPCFVQRAVLDSRTFYKRSPQWAEACHC